MLSFDKYQGLGNDFILFDRVHNELPVPNPAQIRRLCDRRFGVGGDGILLFERASDPAASRMVYFNADGGRAETCFNGLCCIALHTVRTSVAAPFSNFIIATDAGNVKAAVNIEAGLVEVELPGPEFKPDLIPTTADSENFELPLVNNRYVKGTTLSLGNPHFIEYRSEDNLDDLNRRVLDVGAEVERHPFFPRGMNFEAAFKVDDEDILMAVWERGVGRTLACGSGAAASVCAGVRRNILPANRPVKVRMTGGDLTVAIEADFSRVKIIGEAKWVFAGQVSL